MINHWSALMHNHWTIPSWQSSTAGFMKTVPFSVYSFNEHLISNSTQVTEGTVLGLFQRSFPIYCFVLPVNCFEDFVMD